MTLSDFNILERDEKARFLRSVEVIGIRSENWMKVFLHQTALFYVEVFFDTVEEQIVCFRAFDEEELLAPYLEQIDISELF